MLYFFLNVLEGKSNRFLRLFKCLFYVFEMRDYIMCLCAYMSMYTDRDAIAGQYIITIIILNRKFT